MICSGFCRNILKTTSILRFPKRNIYVLGIESSCDDTSAAVVDETGRILGEGHVSQARFHIEAGGIIPSLARKFHDHYLPTVVDTAINNSQISFNDLTAIAVTVKPGLIQSLEAGVDFAKTLGEKYNKPIIPIHHMEAHALTARMIEDIKFPFLVFLLSGGHCLVTLVKSVDEFYTLKKAENGSPGHVLDLIARRAKLKNMKQYRKLVGGAAIEAAAENGNPKQFDFNKCIAFSFNRDCNFSFSCFETTAKFYLTKEEEKHNLDPDGVIPNINDFCASVMESLSLHLCRCLELVLNYINTEGLLKDNERTLVMSGGVACNQIIRSMVKKICNTYNYKFVVPPPKLCTDNGVMIAWNGIERLKANIPVVQPENFSTITETAKCPLGEDLCEDVNFYFRRKNFKFTKLNDVVS